MATLTAKKIGRTTIKIINSIVNFIVLTIILLMVAFAGYAMWDSTQIYKAADASQYAVYKPSSEDSISFKQLQEKNPDVFCWLTVYGTNIDYPVTQGKNNTKYVNTNAYGVHSLSGSVFLDAINDKNFQDFNSILYGHHMEKKAMFGELGSFGDKQFFDSRAYGSLFYGNKEHGLEFFAFIQADAYDSEVFLPSIQGMDKQQEYLQNLLENAKYTRDIGVTAEDHILLLTTCSSNKTNGRDILVARITDKYYNNTFKTEEKNDYNEQASVNQQLSFWEKVPVWLKISMSVFLIILFVMTIYMFREKRAKG